MKTWTQGLLTILALKAVAVRMWLFPWPVPGEVALPDLVRATDSFMHALFASHPGGRVAELRAGGGRAVHGNAIG